MGPPATSLPFPYNYPFVVSASGYAMMTQMVNTAVASMNLTLRAGWLQNVQQYNDNETSGPKSNVNTVYPGAVVQFTPWGSPATKATIFSSIPVSKEPAAPGHRATLW